MDLDLTVENSGMSIAEGPNTTDRRSRLIAVSPSTIRMRPFEGTTALVLGLAAAIFPRRAAAAILYELFGVGDVFLDAFISGIQKGVVPV